MTTGQLGEAVEILTLAPDVPKWITISIGWMMELPFFQYVKHCVLHKKVIVD